MIETCMYQYLDVGIENREVRKMVRRGWVIDSTRTQAVKHRITGKIKNATVITYSRDDSTVPYIPYGLSLLARYRWIQQSLPVGLTKHEERLWKHRYASRW